MRLKARSTGLAAISLALGLAVAPAGFAHGANAAKAPESTRQATQRHRGPTNRIQPKPSYSNTSSSHSNWWDDQSVSSSNYVKSFSQLNQCSV